MRTDPDREYVEYVSARLPALHRTAFLLCGDADRADDVVQATITALYVHWARASRADNLDAYVHRMLVRKFIDEKRLAWSRVALMWRTPEPAADPTGDTVEERDAVVSALRKLPRGQRTVLVLRYFCDLSVEETAQVLGCAAGTVKSQSARAIAAIRPLLDEVLA